MNRIYRIIWSRVSGNWVAVAETIAAHGKAHSQRAARCVLLRPLLCVVPGLAYLPALAQPPAPNALPTGGVVSAGQATISQSGNQMQIVQGSDKAALNWQSFNIGSNAGVTYQQPTAQSVALNRVAGNDPSQIFGTLNANGRVILINPNGVVFGAGSRVDVGGLIATTKALSDADFMDGQYHFAGGGSGVVRNDGTLIAAPDGAILLTADQVINTGTIRVVGGTVGMFSADQLQVSADWKTAGVVQPSVAAINTVTLENFGTIDVSGVQGGRIVLAGGQGTTQSDGQLLATGGQGGAGVIHLSGMQVGLMRGSLTDASGAGGGGEVLVGGDWQGSGSMAHASATYMDADAVVKVNATVQGNGGKAVLWSDGYTNFRGKIEANGAGTGNGGMVETSGKDTLDATGHVRASGVQAGHWLLDPSDVTIVSASTEVLTGGVYNPTGPSGSIANTTIEDALNQGTDVTISTTAGTTGLGHLVQNADADIVKSNGGDATLTLIASLDLALMGNIRSTEGKLNLVLDASGGAGNGSGGILVYKDIATNGGTLEFRSGVYAGGTSTQTFTTLGGAVTFGYDLLLADGLTIDTTSATGPSGEVSFGGRIDSGDSYTATDTAMSWTEAQRTAIGATGGGSAIGDSYLATPMSAFENLIASRTAGFTSGAWLGGELTPDNSRWVWAAGPNAGLVFNTTRLGHSVPPGVYANWSAVQPQNDSGDQTKLQFLGIQGLWNDFTDTAPNIGVIQTNLAASPLVIKATGANVTFGGAVGGLKALRSLTIDGIAGINGGEITTEQGQSYNNPITIGAVSTVLESTRSSLVIDVPVFVAQTNPSALNIRAAQNVVIVAPINTIGPLSLSMTADTDGLDGGAVIVNNPLHTNGGDIALTASSGIQTNGVALDTSGATGAGNIMVVNNAAGQITLDTLTGNTISVTSNVTGLAAGTDAIVLNGAANASGAVTVTSQSGDILVNRNIASSVANDDAAIVIGAARPVAAGNGAGGNVRLANHSALSVAADSRAIIYTGSIAASEGVGAGTGGYPGQGHFRYDVAFNDTARLGTASGVYVQYREQPVLTLAPNGKVYDGTALNLLDWNVYTASGWQNGDTGADNPLTGAPGLTWNGMPVTEAINAGMYLPAPATLAETLGYRLNLSATTPFEISPMPVRAVGIIAMSRVYNATTDAQVFGGNLVGVLARDGIVSLDGLTGHFVDKNAGQDKKVLVSAGLTGANAFNYVFDAENSSTTASIAQAALTLSEITPLDRVYDGTTVVHYSGAPVLQGVQGQDDVFALSENVVGQFADKHVGVDKPVLADAARASVNGTDAGNYIVTRVIASRDLATVTPAILQINGTFSRKLFDATVDSDVPATIVNLMSGDRVDNARQRYNNIAPGNGKAMVVLPGYIVEDGNGGNNYIVQSHTTRGEIISIPTPNGMGDNMVSPDSVNLGLLSPLTMHDDIRQKSAQADYFLQPGDAPRHSSTHAVINAK